MRKYPSIAVLGLLASLVVAESAFAADSDSSNVARGKAIALTLDGIRADLKRHGGSWDAWARSLGGFREDLNRIRTGKWPWPAKDGFTFNGRDRKSVV